MLCVELQHKVCITDLVRFVYTYTSQPCLWNQPYSKKVIELCSE